MFKELHVIGWSRYCDVFTSSARFEHNRARSHWSIGYITSESFRRIATFMLPYLDPVAKWNLICWPHQMVSWKLSLPNLDCDTFFSKNKMFLEDLLFPLSCCTPHLIAQMTAGLLKYTVRLLNEMWEDRSWGLNANAGESSSSSFF